jgi:putative ABC transport system permease protein
MKYYDTIWLAFSEIRKNLFRSLLSILSIMIGIASLLAMTGLNEGMKQNMLTAIQNNGGSNIIYISASTTHNAKNELQGRTLVSTGYQFPLDLNFLALLQKEFRNPVIPWTPGPTQLTSAAEEVGVPRVIGTTPEYPDFFNLSVTEGRFLADFDLEDTKQVIVINESIRQKVYGKKAALGKFLNYGGYRMEVIGVVNSQTDVFIPVTTMLRKILDTRNISRIYIVAPTFDGIDSLITSVKTFLTNVSGNLALFDIDIPGKHIELIHKTKSSFSRLLTAITLISMLVGGIGVMNIMLAVVKERIREIGVRKSIGAKNRQIFAQFLFETLIICLIGGIGGIVAGVWGGESATKYLIQDTRLASTDAIISLQSIILAVSFSVMVGLIFGIYPAFKAARIHAIEALRYE